MNLIKKLRIYDINITLHVAVTHRNRFINPVMAAISNPYLFIAPFGILVIYMFWYDWQIAWRWSVVSCIGAWITDTLAHKALKSKIDNKRPAGRFPEIIKVGKFASQGNSFPSSHAANTAAVGLALCYFYRPFTFLVVMILLLVGYSRVYCGAHYPSDVLVGWLLGLSVTGVIITVFSFTSLL